MLTDTELIRKLDFFEPLDQKIIKRIAGLCIVREFAAGEAIVRQGEAGLGLYFITGGRAKVEIDRDGSKVVVAELKEGDFLGEFSIIDEKTRSASVICLQDTRCLLLTRDSFSKLLKKHPEIATQMLRTLVSRIRNTNERITQPVGTPPLVAEAAPPINEPIPAVGKDGSGFAAATEQFAAMIPKPEDLVHFYSASKNKTQEFLNRFVGAIYAMKVMLRFSMAIVGCPVTVSAEQADLEILEANLNDVKLILFPASNDQTLRIEALADGRVSATVYRAVEASGNHHIEVRHFEKPIRQGAILRLCLPAGQPMRLESSIAKTVPVARRAHASPESADHGPNHPTPGQTVGP